jgi:glycosyltransferase involved in cell wall biosynthesis
LQGSAVNELISLIVATYNRADAMNAVLRSLARQSDKNFEIVIADDGSGQEIRDVIAAWMPRVGVPVKHVWHQDRGYRLPEIRNHALRASAGRYLIWLDGDCIVRSDFVAAHRALAEPGYFVAGNRVLLSQALSERILVERLEPESWSFAHWMMLMLRGEANRAIPLLNLPLGPLRKLRPRRWEGVRGGNMAFFRDDLGRIDGFDASYVGWGPEDSDAVIRMIRSGILRKDGRFATGVLHLWHQEVDRSRLAANRAKLDDLLRSDRVRALRGLSALDEERGAGPVLNDISRTIYRAS